MKRPAFQFYPDNWRNNSNLRRCSWAARGAWVEVICLMHDSERYGVLPWALKEIARALGCPMPLIRELVEKGVLKGCDAGHCEPYVYTPRSGRKDGEPVTLVERQAGPIWYSSRMVRDEYVRTIRGEGTRFGNDGSPPPQSPKPSPKPPIGAGKGASPTARQSDGSSTPSPTSIPPSPPSEARPPRGSRLPADWRPGEEERAFAASLGLNASAVAEQFRDFWHAKAGKDAVKLDWFATWRTWCRRDAERAQKPQKAANPGKLDWLWDEMREEAETPQPEAPMMLQ